MLVVIFQYSLMKQKESVRLNTSDVLKNAARNEDEAVEMLTMSKKEPYRTLSVKWRYC